ncbi:PstS family phosphate ABC transporter substrate-binding protein [Georgenia sp. Z1491]|uniref:PstS family phosphate ABC transporter substrate-binding protein n=1 Tax=Georgenia sp. Z1491 TaxID=3416707 RepID=UPI003CEB0FA5
MKLAGSRRLAGLAAVGAVAMTLAACGGDDAEPTTEEETSEEQTSEEEDTEESDSEETDSEDAGAESPSETESDEAGGDAGASGAQDLGIDYASLSGTLNGSGASSQENGMQAWRDQFGQLSDVTVNYNATGSGTGREQFVGGQVSFIGTDSYFEGDELAAAEERCGGNPIVELPTYVSPIAIAFNLPGVDTLNLTPENVAGIFNGDITSWDAEEIVADNPDADLPALPIIPVNRSDDSGTTENFQQWLDESGSGWEHEPSDVWPVDGTQSAQATSGVVQLVTGTEGAITYADASQIGDLGAASIGLADGEFVEYSAEAATAIVDGSEPAEGASDTRLTVALQRDGSIEGAYPVVQISYHVACTVYEDETEAANVQGFLAYIASAEGQEAAEAFGVAPISDELRGDVNAAIEQISAG